MTWSRVASVSRYVVSATVPGRATTYTTVSGLSTTPPAVAGETVDYNVRTDVTGTSSSLVPCAM